MWCFTGSMLNVNEGNGEASSPMEEYGLDPVATNAFLPSRFICGYAILWHSVKWPGDVRHATYMLTYDQVGVHYLSQEISHFGG